MTVRVDAGRIYATPRPDYTALAWLAAGGVNVVGGDVPRQPCAWCAEIGAVTTVHVEGRPRAEVMQPVEDALVCGLCAPELVERARQERDGDADLIVTVAL